MQDVYAGPDTQRWWTYDHLRAVQRVWKPVESKNLCVLTHKHTQAVQKSLVKLCILSNRTMRLKSIVSIDNVLLFCNAATRGQYLLIIVAYHTSLLFRKVH